MIALIAAPTLASVSAPATQRELTGELDWEFVDVTAIDLEPPEKDIGSTTATITAPDIVTVAMENVYPCYLAEVSVWAHNSGTIPLVIEKVVIGGTEITGEPPYPVIQLDLNEDGDNDIEIWWEDSIGYQIDPCDNSPEMSFSVHVLEGMPQEGTLNSTIEIVAVAWNAPQWTDSIKIDLIVATGELEPPPALTPRAPIYIDGNAGFTPENGVNGGGSGTENDPYIIENWDISAENENGISIWNTTAHFIIRNCYLHDGRVNYKGGIYFENVINGVVDNNIAENNFDGIYLFSSSNNLIINILAKNNYWGISIDEDSLNNIVENITVGKGGIYFGYGSSNNIVKHGIVENDPYWGIMIVLSENIIIENLTVSNNGGRGIAIYSPNNIIKNTLVSNHDRGIALGINSDHTTIANSIFENNIDGIWFYYSGNHIIENIIVSNNAEGLDLWGSESNVIRNITASNNDNGIDLKYGSLNNTITYSTFENNDNGIIFSNSNNNLIHHNNFINNTNHAHDDSTNYWDNGYPSGGNYWSDYTGVDNYRGENQDILGSDGIGDMPYNILGGSNRDRYPLMNPTVTRPDLTIIEVKPVQVIWNCDINEDTKIDLVYKKATAVIATIEVSGSLSEDEVIDIELAFSGFETSQSLTYKELLESDNKVIFYLSQDDYLTIPPDNYEITLRVDPYNLIAEIGETNNEDLVHVTVKDTKQLDIAYFKVNSIWPANYGTPTWEEYTSTRSNSGIFIGATYPVSDDELTNRHGAVYLGDPIPGTIGLLDDLLSLSFWKSALEADRGIGVVSDAYFPYHGQGAGTAGLMSPSIRGSALVREGYWTATAHEVGHTYGLNLDGEDYDLNPPGSRADGFWVSERRQIVNGISFMGYAPPKHTFEYYGGRHVWVADEHYENLFREFKAGGNPHGSENSKVLFVRGMLHKDNMVDLKSMFLLENVEVDPPMTGNYSIRMVDLENQILGETWFDAPFSLYVDPIGIVETDVTGFAFALPWHEETAEILIMLENEPLASRPVSANSPIVEVKYPNGGEVFFEKETVEIEWDATDTDGDNLTFALLYSRDNGESWSPIAIDIYETSFEWTIPENISSDKCFVRVIASDGVNTGEDTSDSTFTVYSLVRTVLPPTDDSYVAQWHYPDRNYGSEESLRLRSRMAGGVSRNQRIFMKFDLSGIPSCMLIAEAKLWLYCYRAHWDDMDVQALAVENDTWGEDTITWNNQPTHGATIDSTTLHSKQYGWYSWDITSFVQDEFEGDKVASLSLRALHEDLKARYMFRSKEYDVADLRPYLEIEYVEVSTTLEPASCEFRVNEYNTVTFTPPTTLSKEEVPLYFIQIILAQQMSLSGFIK